MDLADVDPKYTAMCSDRTLQEEERGFFAVLVETVVKSTNIEDWSMTMWSKSIYGIQFIEELLKEKDVFDKLSEIFTVHPVFRRKNKDALKNAKNSAIQEMKQLNFQKALSLLNQAVIFLPTDAPDSDASLECLLWMRSECSMKLKKYNLALSDLQVIMKTPQSSKNRGSIFHRQGECYKNLGEVQRAKISYNLALKFISEDSSLYQDIKEEICLLNEKISSIVNKVNSENNDANDNTDVARDFLSVAEKDGMGRFVIAKKNISVGEKILAEEPYAASLKFNFYGTHCYHCFERLQISYACSNCANLAFCSTKCRDIAMGTYHKYECSFMELFIGSGMSILCFISLRIVTQITLEKALYIYDEYLSPKNDEKEYLEIDLSTEKEKLIYNLCTHAELREHMDYLKRFLMAFFMYRCLKKSNYFTNDPSSQGNSMTGDEMKILTLLLHNVQMVQFNAHEIEELVPPEMRKSNKIITTPIGVGIYPRVSLFNHDCYQGVARYFLGKKIIMKSIKPISAGEMIPENYGPIFTKRTKYARQRVLRSRYWFKCQCTSCVEIWPGLDQLPEKQSPMFRCPNDVCIGKIDLDKVNVPCDECGSEVTTDFIEERKKIFRELCMKKYEEGQVLLDSIKYESAIDVLSGALKTFHKYAYPPHRETHQAEQNLRTCFIAYQSIN